MEKVTLEQLLTYNLAGKVVCFPTDTVYGVGGLIDDEEARRKIFAMKHRDLNKPLAILVGSKNIAPLVKSISAEAHQLIATGWPGALTLIFKKSDRLPASITNGLDTVGLRMPASKVALGILLKFGPMATTSVNISGQPPLNSVEDIEANFASSIDYLVVDYEESSKQPSRIIDVSGIETKILR